MSKTVEEAIRELQQKISGKTAEINKDKETVNTLCGVAGLPPEYIIEADDNKPLTGFRHDQFYGQPLASSITDVLEARKDLGAATADEIYDALVAGGFKFDAKNDAYAKRSMVISMSKNMKFHRLPNDRWGMRSWYPNIPASRAKAHEDEEQDQETATPTQAVEPPDVEDNNEAAPAGEDSERDAA